MNATDARLPEQAGHQQALLDTSQAAARLGLTDRQLERLRTTRRISYYKRGGRIWYAAGEVERVLRAFEVPALRPVVEVGDQGLMGGD